MAQPFFTPIVLGVNENRSDVFSRMTDQFGSYESVDLSASVKYANGQIPGFSLGHSLATKFTPQQSQILSHTHMRGCIYPQTSHDPFPHTHAPRTYAHGKRTQLTRKIFQANLANDLPKSHPSHPWNLTKRCISSAKRPSLHVEACRSSFSKPTTCLKSMTSRCCSPCYSTA